MKIRSTILATTAVLLVSSPSFASVEDALSNICNIVKANDKGELRKKMKTVQSHYNLRLGDYYDGVICDG